MKGPGHPSEVPRACAAGLAAAVVAAAGLGAGLSWRHQQGRPSAHAPPATVPGSTPPRPPGAPPAQVAGPGPPAPSREVPADGLSAAVRTALAADGAPFDAAEAAARTLPATLAGPDRRAIAGALRSGAVPAPLTPGQWHEVANELLNALRRDAMRAPGAAGEDDLRALLAHLAASADAVVRRYAIQHVAMLGGPDATDPHGPLFAAMDGPDGPGAATALLAALHTFGPDSRPGLETRALAMAAAPHTPAPARAAALQVCAQLGLAAAAPAARRHAASAHPGVRAAAICLLGQTGDPSDVPALEEAALSDDPRTHLPAKAALRSMASRSRNTQP